MERGASGVVEVGPVVVPDELSKRLNGRIDLGQIVGWAEFDLNANQQFAQGFAVLGPTSVVIVEADGVREISLERVKEVSTEETVGADRLILALGDDTVEQMRYSRRCRRDMSRLRRLIERRTRKDAKPEEAPPAWLDIVERQNAARQICPKCRNTIPSYAEGVCPRCLQKKQILLRLLDIAKPHRRVLYFALGAMLAWTAVMAMMPTVTQRLVDNGVRGANLNALLFWGVAMAAVILVSEGLGGLRMYLLSGVGTVVSQDLRMKVYAHLHDLSLRFFNKRRTGSLITRVTSDTERLWDFIVFGSVDFFRNVLMIVIISIVLTFKSWPLALVSLIPLPIVLIATWIRTKKMHRMFGRLWTYYSRMSGVVGDAIPGVRVVKAFSNEKREIDRFHRRSSEYMEKELEVNRAWTMLGPVVGTSMRMGALVVWVAGGYLHIMYPEDPRFSVGMLVAFAGALWMFYGPIMEIANSGRMVTRAATSAQRVFEVLDTPPEIYSKTDAIIKDDFQPSVEFKNVSFSYEGAQPALRDISLKVEPGQMIGLCGSSGAGKSTFVNLICRFYDVTEGQVLVDGVDVRDYDVGWLRKQMGVVLQEPYLFAGSIIDNIRYSRPTASLDEVIAAAKAANAHDFIVGLPDGYDTIVGERGQSLSGGERQRISIARAILHDPKILILDEATSSVDTKTERAIQEALDRLVKGRTTFAIAHRLSTLQRADMLVVFEKGKIVETGTHSELLAKEDGTFAKLHKMQQELSSLVAV